MALPSLPTAEDELGSVANGVDTIDASHVNDLRRLIEALSTSGEERLFAQGLRVGDDTDYTRINPATGRIEFGGTMRPYWRREAVRLHSTASITVVSHIGVVFQFIDGAERYAWYGGAVVPEGHSQADDVTVGVVLASLSGPINGDLNHSWTVYRMRLGANGANSSEQIVSTGYITKAVNVGQRVPFMCETTIAGGDIQAGDTLSFVFSRDASPATADTLGDRLDGGAVALIRGRIDSLRCV